MKSEDAMETLKEFILKLYEAKGEDAEKKVVSEFCENNGINEKLLSNVVDNLKNRFEDLPEGVALDYDKTVQDVVSAIEKSTFNNLHFTIESGEDIGNMNIKDVIAATELFDEIEEKYPDKNWDTDNLESHAVPILAYLIDNIQEHHNNLETKIDHSINKKSWENFNPTEEIEKLHNIIHNPLPFK